MDETGSFGDGRFSIEKDWGDVAGCLSISTAISHIQVMMTGGLDPPATFTLGSHVFAMIS